MSGWLWLWMLGWACAPLEVDYPGACDTAPEDSEPEDSEPEDSGPCGLSR